ncbi:Peptidase S24-like [Marinobacterium lutimaris]|uniref:Peptidase S24-like n=2 Tax=Marinobacterium lutimaris TaxID=568106 RepID=A0A1H5YB65_9GAMM|nr:Peptidase S24-like [Marinobacterium lutimaris]
MDQAFSAGQGAAAERIEDFVDGYEAIDQETLDRLQILPGCARVIKIRGDSMWPTFFDGDKVIADTNSVKLINQGVFAFEFDGDLKVKRFFKRIDGSWLVSSDNKDDPSYPDEVIAPHNAMQLRIIAQIKELRSRAI